MSRFRFLNLLLLAALAAAWPACATEQRYTGQFEKNDVTIVYTQKCGAATETVATVRPQQMSPQVGAPLDTQKMACPWGGIGNVSMSFLPPPAAPDLALPDSRRPQTGFLLESPVNASAAVALSGAFTNKTRSNGQIQAAANIVCGDPAGPACPPQAPEVKNFILPDSASLQARYQMSSKEILVDSGRYLNDASGFTQEFSAYYQTELRFGLYRGDSAFTGPASPSSATEYIAVAVTVRTYFRYRAMPVLDVGDVSRAREFGSNDAGYWIQLAGIRNSGGGALDWSAQASTETGGNWLKIEKSSGRVPQSPGAANVLRCLLDATALDPGVYAGRVRITAAGALRSPQDIAVRLTVAGAPGDRVRLVSVTPDAAETVGAGTDVTFTGAVEWNLTTRQEALVSLRAYDQAGVLLNPGEPGRTAASSGSDSLATTVRLPATTTQVTLKAALLDKTGSLLGESAPVTYRSGIADQVTVLVAGMTPSPAQAAPWTPRLRIAATIRVALGTRDKADVILRGADQDGAALTCDSSRASGGRGQWEAPLDIAECSLGKNTRQVVLTAYLLEAGGAAVLKSSPPVTVNIDLPANSARVTGLGRIDSSGHFSAIASPYQIASGDQASAQWNGIAARVEYDLVGEDGDIDLVVDAQTAGGVAWRGGLVSPVNAPAGAKREILVPLPAWLFIPREHTAWTLRARLSTWNDPPVVSGDDGSLPINIVYLRTPAGFSPAQDIVLGDASTPQAFHIPVETNVQGARLKAYVAYSAYQTGSGALEINDSATSARRRRRPSTSASKSLRMPEPLRSGWRPRGWRPGCGTYRNVSKAGPSSIRERRGRWWWMGPAPLTPPGPALRFSRYGWRRPLHSGRS